MIRRKKSKLAKILDERTLDEKTHIAFDEPSRSSFHQPSAFMFDGTEESVGEMIENWWNKTPKKPNVFIHVPRTGGHSMSEATGEIQFGHWSAAVIRNHLGVRFDQCNVFSVVRNTWDRLLSLYLHTPRKVTFEQFIHKPEAHLWTISQLYFLCDGATSEDASRSIDKTYWNLEDKYGKIMVNKILRFETLNEESAHLGYVLGNIQQTKHKHYSYYYSSEMRDLVRNNYWEEIERFGFVFEGMQ